MRALMVPAIPFISGPMNFADVRSFIHAQK